MCRRWFRCRKLGNSEIFLNISLNKGRPETRRYWDRFRNFQPGTSCDDFLGDNMIFLKSCIFENGMFLLVQIQKAIQNPNDVTICYPKSKKFSYEVIMFRMKLLTVDLDLFKVTFYRLYHGKSPSNHHLWPSFLLLSKSKLMMWRIWEWYPPKKLTWQWKIHHLKMYLQWQFSIVMLVFREYTVDECIFPFHDACIVGQEGVFPSCICVLLMFKVAVSMLVVETLRQQIGGCMIQFERRTYFSNEWETKWTVAFCNGKNVILFCRVELLSNLENDETTLGTPYEINPFGFRVCFWNVSYTKSCQLMVFSTESLPKHTKTKL